MIDNNLKKLAKTIDSSDSILLTTHRSADGDGLGSLLALYHNLKKMKRNVRAVTVDTVFEKYNFLSFQKHIESFDKLKNPIQKTKLALVLDTNDERLIQPLYAELQQKAEKIIFIDHHLLLNKGPKPSVDSIIDTQAASTGEIIYQLLKEMNVEWDSSIATALYTSVLFDTQRFQFIKNSVMSYKVCAEIFPYIESSQMVYSQLFDIKTKEKLNMFSNAINRIEYFYNNKLAILQMNHEEMTQNNLQTIDAFDFIDMTLGIQSIQLAILIMRISDNTYKLGFRSKGINVSRLAEHFNGGGHKTASGATVINNNQDIKQEILQTIKQYNLL